MAQSETESGEVDVTAVTEGSIDAEYEAFATQLNAAIITHESDYVLDGVRMNDKCETLIEKGGGLGSLGKFARMELMTKINDYRELMSSAALSRDCPNYVRLSISDRALVWALILTTMAHFESSCDVAVKANGPSGTARGLWQLHDGKEAGYDGAEGKCVKNASHDPIESVRCTLGMLDNQLAKSGGILFWAKSYWDVLRPEGQSGKAVKIDKALKNSRLCSLH